ncbi:MAG TPA: hypothetical protein VHZ07_00710 [Bryobacteraceae bacterium]|jgi:hypothetical protein|nr:hypothetical protein [Bryobacteraceae bacterium]
MTTESKNRMISFRVTEEEYDRFRNICFSRGIASVSELARAAIDMLVQHRQRLPQDSLEARVAEIEGQIHILSLELMKLNRVSRDSNGIPAFTEQG